MGKGLNPETVEWNGHVYRRYPESARPTDRRYFKRSPRKGSPIYLHREVWEFYFGPIPPNHHIHHKDLNPANNAIENLECLPCKQHLSAHEHSPETIQKRRANLDRIRPLAKAWHSSPEGLEKHWEIGRMVYENFVPSAKPCEACSKVFLPRSLGKRDRFCSNACKSAWRRKSGVDNEQRTCLQCSKTFSANKYSDTKTCSRSCAMRARYAHQGEGLRHSRS